MKLLNGEQLISLVDLGREIDSGARKNLVPLGNTSQEEENLINDMFVEVAKGHLSQTEISRNGKPCYVVYWYRSICGGLNLLCAVSVDRQNDIEVLVKGAEALAKKIQAKFVTFHTRRLGLVR